MSASWPDARQRVARNHHFLVGREHPYRYGTVGGADSRPTPEIGGLKEPRGDVRRVADRGVIHPEVGADTADDKEPSGEALSHLKGDTSMPLQFLLVGEEDGHLLALALQCVFGGENLLGEVLRGVGLGGGTARPSRSPALVAELGSGGKFNAAGGALPGQASTAVQAELGLRRVLVLTLGTLHPGLPIAGPLQGWNGRARLDRSPVPWSTGLTSLGSFWSNHSGRSHRFVASYLPGPR